MKLQPVKPSLPLGNVGFSQVGVLDRGLQRTEEMQLDELNKFVLKNKKPPSEPQSEDEPLDNKASSLCSPEYMQWMKNLALFHQMKEKTEESRAKHKLEDYKMHIVRSLMQKNQMLEEMETKLTRMDKGDDPVQNKILDKMHELERAVEGKAGLRKQALTSEGKLNQMMDFMMYNMSALQQMVFNVAQMQKSQLQSTQQVNKMMENLPQILSQVRYQHNEDNQKPHRDRDSSSSSRKKKKKDRKKGHKRKKSKDSSSEISAIGKSKSFSNRTGSIKKSVPSIELDSIDRKNLERIRAEEQAKKKPINSSDEELPPLASKPTNPKSNNRLIQNSQSRSKNNLDSNKEAAQSFKQDSAAKNGRKPDDPIIEDGKESSGYQESKKPDSITVIKPNELSRVSAGKTMMKDDSQVMSEGRPKMNDPNRSIRARNRTNTDIVKQPDNNILSQLNSDPAAQKKPADAASNRSKPSRQPPPEQQPPPIPEDGAEGRDQEIADQQDPDDAEPNQDGQPKAEDEENPPLQPS